MARLRYMFKLTEPFVLGEEMTESGGLDRLLSSRSQHVSLSRLESSEVTKGMIVLLDPSAFSATLCQDLLGNITTSSPKVCNRSTLGERQGPWLT